MVLRMCLLVLLLQQLATFPIDAPAKEEDLLSQEDDECNAALDGERSSCALSALQRRGQKSISGSVAQTNVEEEVQEEAGRRRRRRAYEGPPKQIIKGISYGPMPCKDGNCPALMDDFMTEAAKPLWGSKGRGDLRTMSLMGANSVRLYGNSPTADHSAFLDEAHAQKLKVVIGMSDYPYTQMKGNCLHNGFNCYEMVKAMYRLNLLKGFVQNEALLPDKSYHPALSTVIVLNEPDLKMPGIYEPARFVKAIISGLDGILDAEKEVGVNGNFVNFTATFSFGVCSHCKAFNRLPGLGQMAELEDAMLHPEAYGYTPKNDLAEIYRTRWIHSFNTAAPAKFVYSDFLPPYEDHFTSTPVVIMEFHTPYWNAFEDLGAIFAVARNSTALLGASFFEFQVRYDKGGTEMEFGMFGLGSYNFGDFDYYGDDFGSWCLKPVVDKYGSVPALVAKAMGGEGPDWDMLCTPDPAKVKVNGEGYAQIASQGPERVATFLARIVRHLGGNVVDSDGLTKYAAAIAAQSSGDNEEQFGEVVGQLASPSSFTSAWVKYDSAAKCVADRDASAGAVGAAIGWACSQATTFDCEDLPTKCSGSVWATADWIFSQFYEKEKGESPLENCDFGGVGVFAASDYPGRRCNQECCSYSGEAPLAPTDPPTLPPKFDPEGSTTTSGPPTPSPEIAGDCHFEHIPSIQYFWDPDCDPRGGPGCNADGRHMKCRFCGRGPFPGCPDGPIEAKGAPSMPSPAPGPPQEAVGKCSFANLPALDFFWDTSCVPHGGPGCNSDGRHMECRFCGKAPFPNCPFK